MYGEIAGIDDMFYEVGGIIGPLTVGIIALSGNMTSIFYFSFVLFLISIVSLGFLRKS